MTWDAPYGARQFDFQYNVEGLGWEPLGWSLSTTRFDTGWVEQGWSYEFMVRTNNGDDAYDSISDWSAPVSAVAEPLTPSPPTIVSFVPTATGFDLSWDPLGSDVIEWYIFFLGM